MSLVDAETSGVDIGRQKLIVRPSWQMTLLFVAVLVMLAFYEPLKVKMHPYDLATTLDRALPLVPIFAIVYIPLIPVFVLLLFSSLLTNRRFLQLALTALVVYFVSDLVYIFFQTVAPRPYVAPGGLNDLVRLIYHYDNPYCDFPSEHCSSATMIVLYFLKGRSRIGTRAVVVLYCLSVVASTLLLKQHTIAGSSSGIALGLISWFAVERLLERRQTAGSRNVQKLGVPADSRCVKPAANASEG